MKRLGYVGGVAGVMLAAGAVVALPRGEVVLTGPNGARDLVRVEIADNDAAREKGLMDRAHLDDDAGMLFVWDQPRRVGFWMKNTRIPLDMLFMRGGRVLAVAPQRQPMDESTVSPPMAVDMVLEVNGGWAARHGVDGPGWRIEVRR